MHSAATVLRSQIGISATSRKPRAPRSGRNERPEGPTGGGSMRFSRRMWAAGALIVLVAATATAVALGGTASRGAKKPIIIGAAVDLTSQMKPFDSAALLAAQLRAQ